MFRSRMVYMLIFVMAAGCSLAAAQDFSVDLLSPEVPAPWSPADIVGSRGAVAIMPASHLGLIATDEVDAFSYGVDHLVPVGSADWTSLVYSVDRFTVGAPGNDINTQATGNGAAGDEFIGQVYFNTGLPLCTTPPYVDPWLWSDAPSHNLTPLPVQSDEDGVDWFATTVARPVYLSVDPATAIRLGRSEADILYQPAPGPFAPLPVLYAPQAALGLLPGDDIDALAVYDDPPVGVFGGGDVVFVSLTPGSPTLGALTTSAASVIQVWPALTVAFPDASLGLLTTDNLNALSAFDPEFIRGDANEDGGIDLFDGLRIIYYIGAMSTVSCKNAADADDDEDVDLFDGLRIIYWLGGAAPAPPPPNQNCGTDPTRGPLGCCRYPPCGN